MGNPQPRAGGNETDPIKRSAIPLVAAVVLAAIFVVLAGYMLSKEQKGTLVRPQLVVVQPDGTIVVTVNGPFDKPSRISAIGWDANNDIVTVEAVVDACEPRDKCTTVGSLTATLELKDPMGSREVVAGQGRNLAPCEKKQVQPSCPQR